MNVGEHREDDDKRGGESEGSDSVGSAADQAKEREREMEESGEENAA
jgi:hypothetical protein